MGDTNIPGFNKCKLNLVNHFMSKPSIIQTPTNEKHSLNVQEVINILNFSVIRNIIDAKLLV